MGSTVISIIYITTYNNLSAEAWVAQ